MLKASKTDFGKTDSWYIWNTEIGEYGGWIEDKKWFKEKGLECKRARQGWTPHCYASRSQLENLGIIIQE